jgi:hypothetical protein
MKTAIALVLCWICPAVARAETPLVPEGQLRFTDKPLTVNFVLGFATPTGEIGATAEYNFANWFAAGAGVGTNSIGTQLAAFGRFRLATYQGPGVAHGLDLVAAFSTGQYEWPIANGDSGYWKERAYWIQAGLDYEVLRPGFRFATGIGFASLAGSSNARQVCVDYCPKAPQSILPTMHVTFGFGI